MNQKMYQNNSLLDYDNQCHVIFVHKNCIQSINADGRNTSLQLLIDAVGRILSLSSFMEVANRPLDRIRKQGRDPKTVCSKG